MRHLPAVLQRLVALAVVAGMAVVIVQALERTSRSVSELSGPSTTSRVQVESDRFACLEALMRSRIPPGARVVNVDPATLPAQRIVEQLTPGYRHSLRVTDDAYAVRYTRPGPCSGLGVSISRVEAP